MAAYALGGGRSTLANQGISHVSGGHASRMLSSVHSQGRAETPGRVSIRYPAKESLHA